MGCEGNVEIGLVRERTVAYLGRRRIVGRGCSAAAIMAKIGVRLALGIERASLRGQRGEEQIV